ncbi:GNAT family N-acetyltransferase [Nocardioides currus]|uniref:GNAT family N-acetyltransferase n=1 Tax=Nocardioides currus TaxID=2133958 RepID=A0A2R7Z3C9_9ACTN|nr:GNAT family N-acetyltransferase [Nocardioides currus]
MPPPTRRLTFRRMVEDDLDAMARLLGDPVVMAHYPRPKTRDEALAWIEWCRRGYARDGFGLWVIEDHDGGFVGDCGLTWQRLDGVDELEVGYHVVADRQGEGLGSEAAAACVDFARSRGVERVIAIIRPDNRASRRVAEKVGLELDRTSVMHDLDVVVYARG